MQVGPPPEAPATATAAVDVYHGVRVPDPFRWLEHATPERQMWLRRQDERARAVFAALPGRDALLTDISSADRGVARIYLFDVVGDGPRLFLQKLPPGLEQWQLWVREGWHGLERLLLDPRERDTDGVHHAIDYARASWDGRFVAYGLSASGSEDAVIEVIDVDTGVVQPDRIDRCQYGNLSWRPDNCSFFYWRRAPPAPDATPAEWFERSATYLHRLGDDPDAAPPVFSAELAQLGPAAGQFSAVVASSGSPWALGRVGTFPDEMSDNAYFVAPLASIEPGAKVPWRQLCGPDDRVYAVAAHGDRLYALSHADADRFAVLELQAADETIADARLFVPEGPFVIGEARAAADGLYLNHLDAGFSRLERISWDGRERTPLALPAAGRVFGLRTNPGRPGAWFDIRSRTRAPTWFGYEPVTGVRDLGLAETWPTSYDHLITEQLEVTSADGTPVPLSVVRRRELPLDGTAPALLNGYGAYGVDLAPIFLPLELVWAERGGVLAYAHVRGGGERGKGWHAGGVKHRKERGVEDFIACAQHLVSSGYTAHERLCAVGGSAGGILVGGVITRRPELFACALLRMPVTNLLRMELMEGGPANVAEFGTVAVPDEFHAMLASDPYHRVRDGVAYPAVVVSAGAHDIRVPIWQPAKLVGRLQAASTRGPVLLRVEWDAGHGPGSKRSQIHEEVADEYAFALWRCGAL